VVIGVLFDRSEEARFFLEGPAPECFVCENCRRKLFPVV
jgi:hypothetical protein